MELGEVIHIGKVNYLAQHFYNRSHLQKINISCAIRALSSLWISPGPKKS